MSKPQTAMVNPDRGLLIREILIDGSSGNVRASNNHGIDAPGEVRDPGYRARR
jgi:hypothetical protein